MSLVQTMMDATADRWTNEAEHNFAKRGAEGVKMHRELWANGQVMVGHEGARANQMVPLARAIEIFRNGWNASPVRFLKK